MQLCNYTNRLLVRLSRKGITLRPNYLLAERALASKTQTFYDAHEIAQMVPIAGLEIYKTFRQKNSWTADFLPNASGAPAHGRHTYHTGRHPFLEAALRSHLGQLLEHHDQNGAAQWLPRHCRRFRCH